VPAYGAGWLPLASSALVQARGFAPRSSDNRSEVLLLDEAWVLGAGGGSRTHLVPLKRRTRSRYVTPAMPYDGHGGVGGTRTPTYLRPRQVGYPLPNDPADLSGSGGRN
jgi:hypothetical protein